jgi:broad specificity phosphatase PhoE
MKILEIRRHSIRSQASDHLNQKGISLARSVGQDMGPFERVVTSTLPRAFETAIAMGFAVDAQSELMSTYGNDVNDEAPWPMSFARYAKVIQRGGAAARYAGKLAAYYESLMSSIATGQAVLVVNHGGVVELGVVGCLPMEDFSSWGDSVSYCEGARLYWENKFIRAEELRVKQP